jgi:hypothetical protein
MADLKLQALDSDDLNILSALCQDAVVQVADLTYSAAERRVALVCNRFDWPAAQPAPRKGAHATYARKRAGLRFERVVRVQYTGFDPKSGGTVLALLAIEFTPVEAPSGRITLQFAAGASLRLDVEYIEAELKDLGAEWSTKYRPDHDADAPAHDPAVGSSKPERS